MLVLDPEVELIAKKINLALSFFYRTASDVDAQYGRQRSASVDGHLLSSTSNVRVTNVRGTNVRVTIMRGDFQALPLDQKGASPPLTPGENSNRR